MVALGFTDIVPCSTSTQEDGVWGLREQEWQSGAREVPQKTVSMIKGENGASA